MQLPSRRWLIPGGFVVLAGSALSDISPFSWLVAVFAAITILRLGLTMLGAMSQPVPEPPPPGELRKVKIEFRCSICGAEVRMTVANDEMPDPPKHCLEEMDLVAPVD